MYFRSSWPVTGDRGPRVKLDVAHDERKQITLQACSCEPPCRRTRLMVHLNVFRLVKYVNDITQMI